MRIQHADARGEAATAFSRGAQRTLTRQRDLDAGMNR